MTKTLGGAVASSVFALALATNGVAEAGSDSEQGASSHATLGGYLTVWSLCAAGTLVAAGVLFVTRQGASVREASSQG